MAEIPLYLGSLDRLHANQQTHRNRLCQSSQPDLLMGRLGGPAMFPFDMLTNAIRFSLLLSLVVAGLQATVGTLGLVVWLCL